MSRTVIFIFSSLLSALVSRNAKSPLVKGPTFAQLEELRSDQPQLEDKHSYDQAEYDYYYHTDTYPDTEHHYQHVEPPPSLPSWLLPLIALICTAPLLLPTSLTIPVRRRRDAEDVAQSTLLYRIHQDPEKKNLNVSPLY